MNLGDVFKRLGENLEDEVVFPALNSYLSEIADDARKNAPTKKIQGAIFIDPAKRTGSGKISGRVAVNLGIAPEGRAYEKGSGLHSKSGKKYIIRPKGKYPLRFFWDKADPDFHVIDKNGKVVLWQVNHPGVAAKPYINPAIKNKAESFRKEFFKFFKITIRASFRKDVRDRRK